jgi:hypothetical protein
MKRPILLTDEEILHSENFKYLKKACEEYFDELEVSDESSEFEGEENEVFEQALFTLYGDEVFDWINEKKI